MWAKALDLLSTNLLLAAEQAYSVVLGRLAPGLPARMDGA